VNPRPSATDVTDVDLDGLRRSLAEAKGDDPLAPATVVTPSGYAAVFVRRQLGAGPGCEGRRGWANITCTTLPALTAALAGATLAGRGLRGAAPAVDLEVIRTEARVAKGWLARYCAHPAALLELQRALVELRRCPPATVGAIGRRDGRGGDLVRLLDAVRHRLHHCGLADEGDVVAAATEAAAGNDAALRPYGTLVTWDLGDLGPTDRHLLSLFAQHGLLHQTGLLGESEPPPPALTEVRTCVDPDEEGRSAVRSVLGALEAGVPLWRQAVLHPPGPTYARILHQHLTAAGVASNGPERTRLHTSVTGRTLTDLLDLATGDWPRHQVVAWLCGAPLTTGTGTAVPATAWDVVSAAAGVVRGPDQWGERLGRLAARGGSDADVARDLATFMDDLVRRTQPPGTTWEAFSTWALGLLDHYLPPDAGTHRWTASETMAAAQVRQVVARLADLDGVSAGADVALFRRAVQMELERTALDTHDVADGGVGDGVFVAPYAAVRGLRFDHVVVTGLADALVPGRGTDDGLLSDDIRRADPSGALPLRAARQHQARHDLWAAVAAGASTRIATVPRGDARTGQAQTPSRWLADLVDADTGHSHVDSFAAGLAAAGPALSWREFRLSQIDRWVRTGGDPTKAPAVDQRLARGFEIGRSRTGARFTRFDGHVGRGRVFAFDPGTPVSATRFETYAKCPRRYLFDRVLRVSARVRPEELWRIEPMTRGSLVHAILESYVAERVHGAPRSLDRLLVVADTQLDEAESTGLVGKALLWRMDRSAIVRDLRRFHLEEGTLEPLAAELSFGGDDGSEPAVTVTLDDGRSVAFRGSIDRVDRTASGHLLVSDYKTGRQGRLSDLTRDPVAGGKLLQLPLYALAAQQRFGGPPPVHARYWLLSGERSAPCFHLEMTDKVEARFRQVVRTIADGVEEGSFPAVPGMPTFRSFSNCTGCDFDDVCPTSRDRQWGRKYHALPVRGVVSLVNGDVPEGLAGSVVKRFVDPVTRDEP
jgi:ATP-dependent helicase/nuclease subunit B